MSEETPVAAVVDSTPVVEPVPQPPKAPKAKKEPKAPKPPTKKQLTDRVTAVEAKLDEVYDTHQGAHRDDLSARLDALEARVKTLEDTAVKLHQP